MKNILFLSTLLFTAACSSSDPAPVAQPTPPKVEPNYFPNMKGCFLLYNTKTNHFDKVIGEENCREQFPACSTFKVPLAVMAFDSGVLKNENIVMKWNGKQSKREVENKDHNAKTWMSDSIVWFSQRLTPRLGPNRLRKYLKEFKYGNEDMSGGITQAWLNGPDSGQPALKISAYEQVEFMKRLWADELPVSKRSMQLTRDLTYLESSQQGYLLHGKTGSNFYKNPKKRLGWFVAHLTAGDQEYVAVTNFSDLSSTEETQFGGMKAREITKHILRDLRLW